MAELCDEGYGAVDDGEQAATCARARVCKDSHARTHARAGAKHTRQAINLVGCCACAVTIVVVVVVAAARSIGSFSAFAAFR